MRPSKVYPFSIPAGGSVNLLVSGDFVKVKSATGSISLTGDTFNTLANILPGQGIRDTDFNRLTLTDETGATNNGYLLVSDSTFIDDRITGNVTVIDQSGDITRSNVAFQGTSAPNAVAAQYAFNQLWNPTAGKVLEVRKIQITSSATAGTLFVQFDTAALTTLYATAANRNYGGTAIGAQGRMLNSAAAPGTLAGNIAVASVAAGQIYTFDFSEPILVPANVGITSFVNTLNTASAAIFYGREVNA